MTEIHHMLRMINLGYALGNGDYDTANKLAGIPVVQEGYTPEQIRRGLDRLNADIRSLHIESTPPPVVEEQDPERWDGMS